MSFWPLGTLMMYGFEPWVEKPVLRRLRALVMKSWGFLLIMGNLSLGRLKRKVVIKMPRIEQKTLKGESKRLIVAEYDNYCLVVLLMMVILFYLNECRTYKNYPREEALHLPMKVCCLGHLADDIYPSELNYKCSPELDSLLVSK